MLSLTQALQLVGLVPCLFLVLFFTSLLRKNAQVLIPLFYFLSLGCHFALPLVDLYPALAHNITMLGALLFGKSLLVAFCFLLILQFITGRVPAWPYWLILAVPLVGSGAIIYASLIQPTDACANNPDCQDMFAIRALYNIFSSSLVFLLIIYYSSRSSGVSSEDINRRHKYWLIIALILLHLCMLGVELAQLAGRAFPEDAEFALVLLRLTFIYIVITSLFRVFYPAMAKEVLQLASPHLVYDPVRDRPHVERIQVLLEGEHVYREMRLNRAALASKVGIGEQQLSRIINGHFGKSFNELINGYRIGEAKLRLIAEPTQITTIAFEVGFNSIASFNRVFKDMVGVSPTEFRGKA